MIRAVVTSLLLAAASLPACTQPPQPPAPPPGMVACTEPRRPMCTREYRPVCGTRRDGARQTYGNACGACADANVASHIPGPCS